MPSADQIATWIGRTRGIMDPALPPKLNATDKILGAAWLSDAILEIFRECAYDAEALDALTETCEQAMLAAGDDVGTRFFVLHLYYWLKRFAEPEEPSDPWDQDAEDFHDSTAAVLRHLVSLVPVGDCPKNGPSSGGRSRTPTPFAIGSGWLSYTTSPN